MASTFLPGHMETPVRVAELPLPAAGFDALTFPRYRPLLAERPDSPDPAAWRIAVGAWLGDRPVGLALVSRPGDDARRTLLSVMVTPLCRRRGVGARLLAAAETLAAARGTGELVARHSSRLKAAGDFEALLRRRGWSAPIAFEHRLAGRAAWAIAAKRDWAPFLTRLEQGGFDATGWGAMTDADRSAIRAVCEDDASGAARAFDPFRDEAVLPRVTEVSIVLRQRGEVVGWITGTRGALADSYHYSNGYVLPRLRRAGWLIGGVREVCERQAAHFGADTLSVFETAADNHPMRRFMDRQLKGYSEWTDTRYRSARKL